MTKKGLTLGCILAFALAVFAPAARATELNQASRFTFNRPVELPNGVTLPTGTYWFVLPDAINEPNLVQVLGPERTQLYATLLTIPTDRRQISDNSKLMFGVQSKGPAALMKWYYPDRLTGHEFIYSPRVQSRIAENGTTTVTAQPASK